MKRDAPSPRVVADGRESTDVKIGKSQAEKTNCAMLDDLGMRTGDEELLCMMTEILPL